MIRELNRDEFYKIEQLAVQLNQNFKLSSIGELEQVYAYFKNDTLIAFIQILHLYETLEIINIIVDENFRNMGIGTELLEYVLNLKNVEHVLLEVRGQNNSAINFYNKNGFQIIRTIKNYYQNDDALVMERKIL